MCVCGVYTCVLSVHFVPSSSVCVLALLWVLVVAVWTENSCEYLLHVLPLQLCRHTHTSIKSVVDWLKQLLSFSDVSRWDQCVLSYLGSCRVCWGWHLKHNNTPLISKLLFKLNTPYMYTLYCMLIFALLLPLNAPSVTILSSSGLKMASRGSSCTTLWPRPLLPAGSEVKEGSLATELMSRPAEKQTGTEIKVT